MPNVARFTLMSSLALALAALAGGCDSKPQATTGGGGASAGSGGASPVCKKPGAPPPAWFRDITAEVLPSGGDPDKAPTATSLRAGDLDGDGYPDLVATGGEGFPTRPETATGGRRDTLGSRTRNVFMNRPDPKDPTGKKRVFVDATEESNLLATRDGEGGYAFGVASLGDVDNDGDLDVAVGPSDPGQGARPSDDPAAVMLNDGKGHFSLGPAGTALDKVLGFASSTAALLDYDKDGALDFLPGTFTFPPPNKKRPILLRGTGDGGFANLAPSLGFPKACTVTSDGAPPCSPMYGLSACDLDMDGDQDILFASYGREPNQIWRNDGGVFTEIGLETGLAYDDRQDFSDDESYRCFCKNRPGVCDPQPPEPHPAICEGFGFKLCQGGKCMFDTSVSCTSDDQCFGDGRGWIPGYSDQPWHLGGNNYSLACGDIDNDGDMDIMTGTIRHGDVGSTSDPSELCLNDAAPGGPLGKFRRPGAKATGIDRSFYEQGIGWNTGDLTATIVDLDNDGLKDIYLCSSDYPDNHGWVYHQKPDHTFEDVTEVSGIGQKQSRGITFFDFDRDGDLDVAIGTSTARVGGHSTLFVYENLAGQDRNWLQVVLEGAGLGRTNRSAIGALVRVTANGVTQQQEIQGGHSASGTQNELVLTFGLGDACAIDKLEVRWLDAASTVETFVDVAPNRRVRVTEGKGEIVVVE
ncbi:MAG: CRTAC1 family protein [Deltaproteobacteria bacterium]|nr:CRTAC1 family protein [Deltaproteobacteria bacterium]